MNYTPKDNGAEYWIEKLSLTPHPEGGYFNQTVAATDIIDTDNLPRDYQGSRKAYTAIYFLLPSEEISHLHRLQSDELWAFHSGSPLTVHIIDPSGNCFEEKLGPNPEKGESFQAVVKAGCWFGATVDEEGSYSLVSCFVAPGFEYEDFELAERESLIEQYPEHTAIIQRLTPP